MISGFSLPSQIFAVISLLLSIYQFLIMARIVLTWVVNSYTLEHHPIGYWLCALTDPFLRLFRRLPFAVIGGVIDISPIFALFALSLLQRFVQGLRFSQSASFIVVLLSMVFQLVISIVSIAKTAVLIAALILLFRLLHATFSKPSSYNVVLSHIDLAIRKLIQGPLGFLNLAASKFNIQIIVLFVVACLLTYLLGLSESLLGTFFLRILAQI